MGSVQILADIVDISKWEVMLGMVIRDWCISYGVNFGGFGGLCIFGTPYSEKQRVHFLFSILQPNRKQKIRRTTAVTRDLGIRLNLNIVLCF